MPWVRRGTIVIMQSGRLVEYVPWEGASGQMGRGYCAEALVGRFGILAESDESYIPGQQLDACQPFMIGDPSVATSPSFSARCLTVTEAVEDVEDYISMAMMQDLSTGDHPSLQTAIIPRLKPIFPPRLGERAHCSMAAACSPRNLAS